MAAGWWVCRWAKAAVVVIEITIWSTSISLSAALEITPVDYLRQPLFQRVRRIVLGLAVLAGVLVVAIGGYVFVMAVDSSIDGQPVSVYKNVSGAMDSTVLVGERFTVVSLRGEKGELIAVGRGDVITHRWPPDTSKVFVKRIVAVPGDTIAMIEGVLQLNGRVMSERYAHHEEPDVDPMADDFDWQRAYLVGNLTPASYRPSRNTWGPILIPRGSYFVLGDNRDNSLDSRYWGFLPAGDILARARRVYLSRDPKTGRIRWNRLAVRIE